MNESAIYETPQERSGDAKPQTMTIPTNIPKVVVSDVPTSTRRYATVRWYVDSDSDNGQDSLRRTPSGSLKMAFKDDFSRRSSLTSSSLSDSELYETDLEDVDDYINSIGVVVTDPNPKVGDMTYLTSCKELATVPQSAVTESLSKGQLKVACRNMGDRDVIPLARALKLNASLRELDLSGNSIGYAAMAELSTALRKNTTIEVLNLSGNNMGVLGAAALAELMQHNSGVRLLDISNNQFEDEAAKFLAIGIEVTTRIEDLNLSNNKFGEQGGLYLGVALQKNESIRHLNIAWNALRLKGAVKMIQGVQENMMTTSVDASYNGFGYEGALAVQRLLVESIYVTTLDLTANRIDWRCAEMLAEGIAENSNLEILKIGKNPLTTTGGMDLIYAVASLKCGLQVLELTDVPVVRDFVMIAQTIAEIREFSYTHGGVVSYHDFLGRRDIRRIDPMQKLKDFMVNWGIRPNELFRIINKKQKIEMDPEEFVVSLKNVGVPVTKDEFSDILKRMEELNKRNSEGISFTELLSGIKTQEIRERKTKMRERDQQILRKVYHDRILHPELPALAEDKEVTDIDKKFQLLLLEQSQTTNLPPIDLNASLTTRLGSSTGRVGQPTDLLASMNSGLNNPKPRQKAPKVMSMTRSLGAKSKGFGENYKKKKKRRKRKSIKKK